MARRAHPKDGKLHMPIEWRPEMAVDQGVIDYDHQVLIAIINNFCSPGADKDELSRMQNVLKRLDHYARIHFAREEKLQAVVRYPYCDAHHQQHRGLIRQLEQFRQMLAPFVQPEDEGDKSSEKSDIPLSTLRAKIDVLLHDWLVDHVVKSDLRMKPYAKTIAQHGYGLEPLLSAKQPEEYDTVLIEP